MILIWQFLSKSIIRGDIFDIAQHMLFSKSYRFLCFLFAKAWKNVIYKNTSIQIGLMRWHIFLSLLGKRRCIFSLVFVLKSKIHFIYFSLKLNFTIIIFFRIMYYNVVLLVFLRHNVDPSRPSPYYATFLHYVFKKTSNLKNLTLGYIIIIE